MPEFAKQTTVAPEKTRAEIETMLRRYKADSFFYGWDDKAAMIAFRAFGRNVRFLLPMPDKQSEEFKYSTNRGRRVTRPANQQEAAFEQSVRQRWRALLLVIKAKLEAIECKISTFEQEFLAFIILPNGETVGQWIAPQVETAYQSGAMPNLLLYKPELKETT